MRLFALVLLCAATPAFAADQFDLACQGTKISKRDGAPAPYTTRVRLDLAAKRWCTDACQRVMSIDDVQPDKIVIKDDSTLNTREESTIEVNYDRTTHAYHRLYIQERPDTIYEKEAATCTEQPFTPFPAATHP